MAAGVELGCGAGCSVGFQRGGARRAPPGCRVLDATVPHIFDPAVFKQGDPVHFKFTRPAAYNINPMIAAAFALEA